MLDVSEGKIYKSNQYQYQQIAEIQDSISITSSDHWIAKSMENDRYDYYLINFANGEQIICKNFKEFCKIVKEIEDKMNKLHMAA